MFICNADDCPNKGVEYNWGEDAPAFAMCGGCGVKLVNASE
jgi:hypothetical protein